eukprot:scaffold2012_cov181-Chaetoceros_neogracile.AAC.2
MSTEIDEMLSGGEEEQIQNDSNESREGGEASPIISNENGIVSNAPADIQLDPQPDSSESLDTAILDKGNTENSEIIVNEETATKQNESSATLTSSNINSNGNGSGSRNNSADVSTTIIETAEVNDGEMQSGPPPLIRQQPSTAKTKVHLIAVGSAPLLKKSKFLLPTTSTFGTLQTRLRKMLSLGEDASLYLYVQQSFVPSEEDWIGDLDDLYSSTRDELQIHYSLLEAWG